MESRQDMNTGHTETVDCTDSGISSEGKRVTWMWPPSFVLKCILKATTITAYAVGDVRESEIQWFCI